MNTVTLQCPACFEWLDITVDPGESDGAEWVTDCEVCCRPMRLRLRYTDEGWSVVELTAE